MSRCCRSLPRCASCPVRLAAARRARATGTAAASRPARLVDEVFAGGGRAPVPPAVEQALERLDRAREAGRGGRFAPAPPPALAPPALAPPALAPPPAPPAPPAPARTVAAPR